MKRNRKKKVVVKREKRTGATRGTKRGKFHRTRRLWRIVREQKERRHTRTRKKHTVNKEVLWNLRIPETSCRRRRVREKESVSCAERERNPMKPRNLSGILQDNLWAVEMRRADKFYKLKVWKADWKKCQNDSIEMNTLVFSEVRIKITCNIISLLLVKCFQEFLLPMN